MSFIIDNVSQTITADNNFSLTTTSNDIVFAPAGNIDANTNLITTVVDPVSAQDAATKNYVDVNFQPLDAVLTDLAALAVIEDNEIMVGTATGTYANESGATARGSLGAAPLDAAYIVSGLNGELSAENVLAGTSNEIDVATSTIGLADDAVFPGVASITIPVGTTGQEPAAVNGMLRYDSTTNKFRVVISAAWTDVASGGINNVVEDTTPQLGGQLDVNTFGLGDGTNLLLGFIEDASAVNFIQIENESTGAGPTIRVAGSDSNTDLLLEAKGDGNIVLNELKFATLTNATADATPTELFLDGATTRITVASGDKVAFKVTVAGKNTSVSGDICMYIFEGAIKNIAGTTSISGTAFKQTLAEDDAACDAAVTADDTNDSLKVEVTGIAATNYSWRAKVEHFIM